MSGRLKILMAGTANPHVPGYLRGAARKESPLDLLAVSDFDSARLNNAREILQDMPTVEYYSDYIGMLDAHCEAEAVIIGSDNKHHLAMFKEAVKRKLHIYMMKVISMNEDECREMMSIGDGYPKIIQCELELHFRPQFRLARQIVQSGALGKIKSVYLTNISQSPCNYFPNWSDPELSYGRKTPIRPGAKLYRGGAITDHPHPYDLIRWIFGREFRTVCAMSASNQRAHLAVEDHAAITGELDDGTKYFINPSYSNLEEKVEFRRMLWPKSLECNLKITGSKGYFATDYFDRHCYVLGPGHASPDRLMVDGTPGIPGHPEDSLAGSFAAAIRKHRLRPESTLADSYAAVRVMNAAYDSIYSGQTVEL